MRKLLLFGLLLASAAHASPITVDAIYSPSGLLLSHGRNSYSLQADEKILTEYNTANLQNKSFDASSNAALQCRGNYDFAVDGGAAGLSKKLCNLPANAIITKAWYTVPTALTSSASAQLRVSSIAAGDIVSAAIYSNAKWSNLLGLGIPVDGSTSTWIKLGAATSVNLDILVGAVTAGKISVFVDYSISQ